MATRKAQEEKAQEEKAQEETATIDDLTAKVQELSIENANLKATLEEANHAVQTLTEAKEAEKEFSHCWLYPDGSGNNGVLCTSKVMYDRYAGKGYEDSPDAFVDATPAEEVTEAE